MCDARADQANPQLVAETRAQQTHETRVCRRVLQDCASISSRHAASQHPANQECDRASAGNLCDGRYRSSQNIFSGDKSNNLSEFLCLEFGIWLSGRNLVAVRRLSCFRDARPCCKSPPSVAQTSPARDDIPGTIPSVNSLPGKE